MQRGLAFTNKLDTSRVAENQLTHEEIEHLGLINDFYGDDLDGVIVHNNFQPPPKKDAPPYGVTFNFGRGARLSPGMLDEKMGTTTMVAKIVGRANDGNLLDDAYFRSVVKNLESLSKTSSCSQEVSLDVLGKTRDTRPWKPSLGDDGYIQVTKIESGVGQDIYYLLVQSTPGKAGKELKDKVYRWFSVVKLADGPATPTPGNWASVLGFLSSKEYVGVIDLSHRNARRLLFEAAQLLKVTLEGGSEDDRFACLEDPRHEPPQLANPFIINDSNVFIDHTCEGGKCSYYSGTTPVSKSVGALIVDSSPISQKLVLHQPQSIGALAQWAKSHPSVASRTAPTRKDYNCYPKYLPKETYKPSEGLSKILENTTTYRAPQNHIPSVVMGLRADPTSNDLAILQHYNGAVFGHSSMKHVISSFN